MHIEKKIEIFAPLKKIYETYANILLWKKVLSDVVDVTVAYDDGLHQDFTMTVQRGNHQETVRSIRFCFPLQSIEIFQTQPPPHFTKMQGVWTFHSPERDRTIVRARREFEAINPNPALLGQFLEQNLLAFKKWIELSP